MDPKICHPNSSASHWRLSEIQQSHLSRGDLQQQPGWWQLKYVLFSPQILGKMNPFWHKHFSKGLVQPPTTTTHCNQKLGGSTTIASCCSCPFFCQVYWMWFFLHSIDFSLRNKKGLMFRGHWKSKKSQFPLGKTLEKPDRLEAFSAMQPWASLSGGASPNFPVIPSTKFYSLNFALRFFGDRKKQKIAKSVYGESFCW